MSRKKMKKADLLKKFRNIRDVWLIGEIDDESSKTLLTEMRDIVEEIWCDEDSKELMKNTVIRLNICSIGGDVDPGWSICNYIRNCPVPVWTHVSGTAQSMAAAIFMAGEYRSIGQEASMMVHHFQITTNGTPLEASKLALIYNNNEKYYAKLFPGFNLKERVSDQFFNSEEVVKNGWADFVM